MYSIEGIKKGLRQPRYVVEEFNRLYHRKLYSWPYNVDGIDIVAADWDNLLILDACRYDLFERANSLPGDLEAVESRGSSTREFLRANFDGREMLDTVYVTASPMLYRHSDEVQTRFHATVEVWKDQGWDSQYRTVLPETVTEAAIEAAERFPDKRLLVHYLQPHYPFIGETGKQHFDLDRLDFQWDEVATGELGIPEELVREAYEENLDVVLPSVETLLETLQGKTVVTADHGQAVGERGFPLPIREYGHPPGIYSEGLVTVPWHSYQNGARKQIVAEEPLDDVETDREDEDVAQERLRHLGYVE